MQKNIFPFVAIVGQERLKKAILIAILNHKVGGLLIGGNTGSGKTVIARSIKDFCLAKKVIEVPLNITEDVLCGSIDIEKAILNSEKKFAPGILARANGNIMYIDDANLLREDLMKIILDVNAVGENIIEIDGISFSHPTYYSILATINLEDTQINKNIFERFGMYVECDEIKDVKNRVEIMKRVLEYGQNKDSFREKYKKESEKFSRKLGKALKILPKVEVSNAIIELVATVCMKACCEGHKTELYLIEVAKTIAALDSRYFVLPKDINEASEYTLVHKLRKNLDQQKEKQEELESEENSENSENESEPKNQEGFESEENIENEGLSKNDDKEISENSSEDNPWQKDSKNEEFEENSSDNDGTNCKNNSTKSDNTLSPEENLSTIDKNFKMPKIILELSKNKKIKEGEGKRSLTKTSLKQGRYVRAMIPKGKVYDIAFDATIRVAAPYQKGRGNSGKALNIKSEDLRQKVREKKVGSTFLFIVDASGSMGARERMRAVKGALFTLLQEAYQKRDKVGLIVFRRNKAELILPITRSITLAKKHLENLSTGGKTPLPDALNLGLATLQLEKKKQTSLDPVVFILTDGRANESSNKNYLKNPLEESLELAKKYAKNGINTVLIDTESGFIKLGYAKKIAEKMNASYFTIKKITKESILKIIKNTTK